LLSNIAQNCHSTELLNREGAKATKEEEIKKQMTIQDLRKARKFTQIPIAELLKLFAACKILD
jgi:hypothetical protein